jgi:hypothetical protein
MLFLLRLERAFVSHLGTPLPRDALVNGNPVQPRGNFGFAAKSAQIAKRRQEGFLSRVAGVLLTPEHAKGKREDSSLPALNNLAESLRVAR